MYRIMIVDDDKEFVEYLKRSLIKDYQISTAYDGEEALEVIKEENPDLVILDLMLPKLNGFQVLKRIRENFKDRWRPVIIVSTKTELDSIKKSYDLEADHYLTKPIKLESLYQAIKTMISLIPLRETKN